MKYTLLAMLTALAFTFSMVGCAERTKTESTTTVTTPEGETTVIEQREVKKSGENPPPSPK